MLQQIFNDYTELGLNCIPIEWDIEAKQPKYHVPWNDGQRYEITPAHNALMIRTNAPYHCLDFDMKNTTRTDIFTNFITLVELANDKLLGNLYIERTRNGGYHVWFRHPRNLSKLSLAESERGAEVIALYAGQPLVYTYPTPGYTIHSGSMEDLDDISDAELDLLLSTAQYFNEYKPKYDPTKKAVTYPPEHALLLAKFDQQLPQVDFEVLLDGIGLTEIKGYRYKEKDKFSAWRRKDSESNGISAKVYRNRVMLFTASLPQFPNWHNKHEYDVWCLPPSFVLFYQHGRDWSIVADIAAQMMEHLEIEIPHPPPAPATTGYPYEVFPDAIRQSIHEVARERSLCPEFVALNCLYAVSALAGTAYVNIDMQIRNILFCMMTAPVSVGKTPAFVVPVINSLADLMAEDEAGYKRKLAEYNAALVANAGAGKKQPGILRPKRYLPIVQEGTTESFLSVHVDQPNGLGIYYDEAESIMTAGAHKKENDAISFFTTAFNGGRFAQLRVDREKERVISDLNINVMMGTQPNRLRNIFTRDRIESGFASRFLLVYSDYRKLNDEADPFAQSREMCHEWRNIVEYLYKRGREYNSGESPRVEVRFTPDAKDVFRSYTREQIREANKRMQDQVEAMVIGAEAKMSMYFPRMCQIIAIMRNPVEPVITAEIVHMGHRLYRWHADSTIAILRGVHSEIEGGLPAGLDVLYNALPDTFSRKEAVEVCTRMNLGKNKFEVAMRKPEFARLFKRVAQGKYEKLI